MLDREVSKAAEYHCSKHVVKMILEYSQLLCTAHRILDGIKENGKIKTGRSSTQWVLQDDRETLLYKATHINHPSAVWVRESSKNYNWLKDLLFAVSSEYCYRYGRLHKCDTSGLLAALEQPPKNIPIGDMTPLRLAMPDEYKLPDPVDSYRNYYRNAKSHLHNWSGRLKSRETPYWI